MGAINNSNKQSALNSKNNHLYLLCLLTFSRKLHVLTWAMSQYGLFDFYSKDLRKK